MTLISVEARSARVSATLDARPALGSMWRRLVSMSEATASLSMEDVPVPEQDILSHAVGSSMVSGDPQAAQIARGIHAFIQRPGNILTDPGGVFDRAMQAGRLTSLIDEDTGGRIAYHTSDEKEDWKTARQEFEIAVRRILKHDAPIIFRLFSFSSAVSKILPERVPIAERLIFMASESILREREALSDPLVGLSTSVDFDFRTTARWTLTPSIALSRGGFRAWSPASEVGQENLATRLNNALSYNVGHLAQLNAWMQEIDGFTGKTAKSRRTEIASLFLKSPILSSEDIAETLGISARAVRNTLDDAVERKLVTLLTPRRSYRLWAVPVMAKMILDRPTLPRHKSPGAHLRPSDSMSETPKPRQIDRFDNQDAISIATQELDEAIAKADRILAKYNLQSEIK